jgi:hypothetical protein
MFRPQSIPKANHPSEPPTVMEACLPGILWPGRYDVQLTCRNYPAKRVASAAAAPPPETLPATRGKHHGTFGKKTPIFPNGRWCYGPGHRSPSRGPRRTVNCPWAGSYLWGATTIRVSCLWRSRTSRSSPVVSGRHGHAVQDDGRRPHSPVPDEGHRARTGPGPRRVRHEPVLTESDMSPPHPAGGTSGCPSRQLCTAASLPVLRHSVPSSPGRPARPYDVDVPAT